MSKAVVMMCAGLSLIAFGCGKKADKATCEAMVEHDYGVIKMGDRMGDTPAGQKILAKLKKSSLDACVGKMSLDEVECHMKATTAKAIDACK